MITKLQGTLTFWARPIRPTGLTDALPCPFPLFENGPIEVTVYKNANGTITITVLGPHDGAFTFAREPIPTCDGAGLFVTVTWDSRVVTLHLEGIECQRLPVPARRGPPREQQNTSGS